MKTVGVVTVARSDFGIYRPVLDAIERCAELDLRLIVAGMHLAPEFGSTEHEIECAGYRIADRVEMLLSSDTPLGTAKSIGLGVIGFAESYTRSRPDLLIVLGDRFEMHAAALAALPLGIPVAHIHGGEVTEGAIDDALRHGISKIAHLHFVSTEAYRERLERMGEEPWRITVSGAPSLDNLKTMSLLEASELERLVHLSFPIPPLLVTMHPITREPEGSHKQLSVLLDVLRDVSRPVIFTLPNADAGGRAFIRDIQQFVAQHDNSVLVDNLGTKGYFSAMRHAAAMIGNSSSGIIEAASFALPVVNIGSRQKGRLHPSNVIDVADGESAIAVRAALDRALSESFRASVSNFSNPYGDGDSARRIVDVLQCTSLDSRLIRKAFYDAPTP